MYSMLERGHMGNTKRHESRKEKFDEKKFPVSSHIQDGYTPLHGASYCGHADVVKHLLDVGADVNAKNQVCLVCFSVADQKQFFWVPYR